MVAYGPENNERSYSTLLAVSASFRANGQRYARPAFDAVSLVYSYARQ
jgi:hypothetical protein